MKTIILTAQDIADLVCGKSNKYSVLEEVLFNRYVGDMSIECTYDYIFEVKETKEQYIVRANVEDVETNEYLPDWEDCFLDAHENEEYEAQKGTWINTPRFIIDK